MNVQPCDFSTSGCRHHKILHASWNPNILGGISCYMCPLWDFWWLLKCLFYGCHCGSLPCSGLCRWPDGVLPWQWVAPSQTFESWPDLVSTSLKRPGKNFFEDRDLFLE